MAKGAKAKKKRLGWDTWVGDNFDFPRPPVQARYACPFAYLVGRFSDARCDASLTIGISKK